MTTKKQKKGKTMALTDFLAAEPKTVTVRGGNWSEIVDSEEAETKPVVIDIGVLPTAPRGAVDIDYSNLPNTPPFVAHIANLSFEVDDEGLRRIFADLNPKAARLIKDGMRSRGIGLVEFETRENLIDALKRTDKEIYGRKIRVNVSDKTDVHQSEGGRGTFGGQRSHRGGGSGGGGGEERPEMADRWKRAEPRSDEPSESRSSGGFNRDRPNRSDYGRSNMGGGSRDNHGNDYGFGYPRTRDERGGGTSGGNRDYNRQGQGQRNRYHDDDNRSNNGVDRPRYSGRYSDTRDTREKNRPNDETADDQREPPRERQRLQLQPRTKPLEEFEPLSGSSSSVNNVAANAANSSTSNADNSSSSITNTSPQQTDDSSINENRGEEYQQQESRDSHDRTHTSDEQPSVKPSRGAGASIFGGAKPVDTTARELEIEKKLKELQMTTTETTGDTEEKTSSSRTSYNRGNERDTYRGKRSSHNDDRRDRERERKDDDRSGHGGDYHHRREYSGGRQYEDEGPKRNDDDQHQRRGGGYDRDRTGGSSRRDYESGRSNKYNQQNPSERDKESNNNRNREREDRNQDPDEFSTYGRPSNNTLKADSQSRNPARGMARRPLQTEDEAHKLQLSNKFGMLDQEDLDDDNENDDAQSPSIQD